MIKHGKSVIKKKSIVVLVCIMLSCQFSSCGLINGNDIKQPETRPNTTVEKEPAPDINDVTIQDDKSIYKEDDDDSVVTMYLTVRRGNSAENTDHSWTEVNQHSIYYYRDQDIERNSVESILQVGDENGPISGELGYDALVPNAIVSIRGATTSKMPQKSYKISIKDNMGSWRGQRTIALNKHVFDNMRFRNKLSYDYIKQMHNMIGLRTQFVHLYVRDETEGQVNAKFVDYGLFTQVEQPNTRFLKNHNLDSGGQLYKATSFEFFRYADKLKLSTDPAYDRKQFERILEIKGSEEHTKLLDMLDAVNDYGKPIEGVFDKYFDEENYFTWLAFNILIGNIDTQTQNYYLYSPTNSNTWYFISWDCDGAWRRYEDTIINNIGIGFELGISNYWGVVLHKRVLSVPRYRELLEAKIQELRVILKPEKTKAMIESYRKVTDKYNFSMPDRMYVRLNEAEWNDVFSRIPSEVDKNYELYKESLERPMPFFLGIPETIENKNVKFLWNSAYDLDLENVSYRFELSKTYLFDQHIADINNLKIPTVNFEMLLPGQYFYRVTAVNKSGYSQNAIDYYVDKYSHKHYGIKCFYVLNDGRIIGGERREEE